MQLYVYKYKLGHFYKNVLLATPSKTIIAMFGNGFLSFIDKEGSMDEN